MALEFHRVVKDAADADDFRDHQVEDDVARASGQRNRLVAERSQIGNQINALGLVGNT
jgi:hypothetical protein